MESRGELERASQMDGSTSVAPLDARGGGNYVRLTDPVGHHVYLVHGQKKV